MNLNLHLVDIRAEFAKPETMDQDAQAALSKSAPTLSELRALAELVDWEQGQAVTGLGKRCKRALDQLASHEPTRTLLLKLAKTSPAVKAALAQATKVVALAA